MQIKQQTSHKSRGIYDPKEAATNMQQQGGGRVRSQSRLVLVINIAQGNNTRDNKNIENAQTADKPTDRASRDMFH